MAGREPSNMQTRVVLVNAFTVETVHMLNRFAVQAERGLEHVNECAARARGRTCTPVLAQPRT
jgi:formyltetrahydrofolate synthetase